jgi:hypothetical protein
MGEINNLRNLLTPAASGQRWARWQLLPRELASRSSQPWPSWCCRASLATSHRRGLMRPAYAHWRPSLGLLLRRHIRHRADRCFDSSRRVAFRLLHGLLQSGPYHTAVLGAMCSQSPIRRAGRAHRHFVYQVAIVDATASVGPSSRQPWAAATCNPSPGADCIAAAQPHSLIPARARPIECSSAFDIGIARAYPAAAP